MTEETKPSNPKDAIGGTKVSMGLCPDTAIIEMAMAFLEGARKYGRFNWRVVGVSASIYSDAIERHHSKWWNGQDRDPVTKVRELASVMACCAILIDAEICGVLNDDRPPMAPVGELLDANMELIAHLKELFAAHDPKQYTWEDTPHLAAMNEALRQAALAEAFPAGPLEPEGFPNGYAVDASAVIEDSSAVEVALAAETVPFVAPPLLLDCGCYKRCKGHKASSPGTTRGAAAVTETQDAEFPQPPRAYHHDSVEEAQAIP